MNTKEERKIDEREEIKEDRYENQGGGYGKSTNPVKIKDYQKLIISIILIVVLVLMIALKANVIAGMVVAITLGIVVYLLHKEKESLK